MIDLTDGRFARAVELADAADTWLPCRTADGLHFGIPSQREPGVYHLADATSCTCPDFVRHQLPCKHVVAVAIHAARTARQPLPASVVIDGLRNMLDRRTNA